MALDIEKAAAEFKELDDTVEGYFFNATGLYMKGYAGKGDAPYEVYQLDIKIIRGQPRAYYEGYALREWLGGICYASSFDVTSEELDGLTEEIRTQVLGTGSEDG